MLLLLRYLRFFTFFKIQKVVTFYFLPCFLELWCLCCIYRKQSVQEGSGRGTPKKSSGTSSPSRSKSPTSAQSQPGSPVHSYGKLIVCKRFCQRVGDVADDPIELRLLYAQAVHYVVHVRPPCYHVISYRTFGLQIVYYRLRSRGGQRKPYNDTLKANLKRCDIAPPELEELALDRSVWRSHCKT